MPGLARTRAVLEAAVRGHVFPGAVVHAAGLARDARVEAVGTLTYAPHSRPVDERTTYDLASLTKVLCTATLVAQLTHHATLSLDDRVARWIDGWRGHGRELATIRDLLLHASGLPAYRRYFETRSEASSIEDAIVHEVLDYELRSRSVYSDPGFILLGRILERAAGATLQVQFARWWQQEIGVEPPLAFLPPAAWLPRTAPTEVDPWRGRLLHGEVHDENAAALGGVAGHAGLFGDAASVARCAEWWMARVTRAPWSEFVRRGPIPGSSRALGWDTMLPTSSCGTQMSPAAFGHTGFTGASLWIDPERDCYVVFLSNRVHPTRAGDAMRHVRPAVHDAVAEDLARG